MKKILQLYFLLLIIIIFSSCAERISHSGNIISFDEKIYRTLTNKSEVENYMGLSNYIDPIEKKHFYFNEKTITKNFFNKKIVERKLLIFHFNADDTVKSLKEYNLDDQKEIDLVKEQTSDDIIKKGLLEKYLGGVGTAPAESASQ